ncbi:LOW QUALITY PROTEIN: hypothetical protein PHMEG_0009843 [Phytophthora megakarya]|uniref:Uncharacterized protein n=1 Tax=Phytophthora megakarya TaxID=4795 RepID=A0A225WF71_9STRA|nr:LOW QUALITY PROTEIN: hypothetical protein PHMEG_0009843 [Phytophthora megakarya]
MPLTNAQLRAEIDRLNQAMVDRSKVPNSLPKFTGKRGKDVREWLFQIENACRINVRRREHKAARDRRVGDGAACLGMVPTLVVDDMKRGAHHVLQHFESSNYQAALREKLLQLKQTADIETHNGEYSAFVFRVDGMSDLYQYEVTHFVVEARVRQGLSDKKENSSGKDSTQGGHSKPFRGKGRFKDKAINTKAKSGETRTCFHCKKPVNEGRAVVKSVTRSLKVDNISINVLCGNPLVYKSSPLFTIHGEISAGVKHISSSSMLVDTGATTIYAWGEKNKLTTTRFQEKKHLCETWRQLDCRGRVEANSSDYQAIPDEFDCILGVPFFEDIQPLSGQTGRRIEGTKRPVRAERTSETIGPIEGGGLAIASGSRRFAGAKGLSAKIPDFCRGVTLETNVKPVVKVARETVQSGTPRVACEQQEREPSDRGSAKGSVKLSSSDKGAAESCAGARSNAVEKIFTMGVVDAAGVVTKLITQKKLRKFLQIKTKYQDKPDFVLTIKRVPYVLHRCDQPDNVGSAKAQRYLDTDWETFRANPAYDLLKEYKDTAFRPELPEGLPEKSEIDHRIAVRDPNLAMY